MNPFRFWRLRPSAGPSVWLRMGLMTAGAYLPSFVASDALESSGNLVSAQVAGSLLAVPAASFAEAFCLRAFGGQKFSLARTWWIVTATELLALLKVMQWACLGAVPGGLLLGLYGAHEAGWMVIAGALCLLGPALWRYASFLVAPQAIAFQGFAYSRALESSEASWRAGGRLRFAVSCASIAVVSYAPWLALQAAGVPPEPANDWTGGSWARSGAVHASDVLSALGSVWLLTGLFRAAAPQGAGGAA